MEDTMSEAKKPTLKELLKRHDITYIEFYEFCQVPTEDISIMYRHNQGTKTRIQRMLAFINDRAKTSYTIDDIFIEKMF
jgi:hypothetical protein